MDAQKIINEVEDLVRLTIPVRYYPNTKQIIYGRYNKWTIYLSNNSPTKLENTSSKLYSKKCDSFDDGIELIKNIHFIINKEDLDINDLDFDEIDKSKDIILCIVVSSEDKID